MVCVCRLTLSAGCSGDGVAYQMTLVFIQVSVLLLFVIAVLS